MKNKWAFFSLAALCFSMGTGLANAQTYKGQVIDEFTRKPVPYVTVSLQNKNNEHIRHSSTDENGYYVLQAPEPSDYYVHVKRIGYSENTGGPFFVEADDTLNVIFRIMEIAEELGEITVEGTPYEETLIENYLKSKNFYTRKKQGLGQFFTKEEIRERHAINTSDIFRYTHGIQKVNGRILNRRHNCTPKIVLNGMTMTSAPSLTLMDFGNIAPLDMDLYTNVNNLVGIELYTGLPGQPAHFGTKSRCGAIVLWTR